MPLVANNVSSLIYARCKAIVLIKPLGIRVLGIHDQRKRSDLLDSLHATIGCTRDEQLTKSLALTACAAG